MKAAVIALAALATLGCRSRTGLPAGSLAGQVVVDGGSAAGLTVAAVGADSLGTTTDGDGRYRFDNVPLGIYTITVSVHDTVESTRSANVTVSGPVDVPELRFTAAGGVRGRVTRGGAPNGNAGILVTVDGTDVSSVTSDDGGYAIALVPVGSYDLTAQASGFQSGSATGQKVRWGEETDVPQIDLVVSAGPAALHGVALLYDRTDHSGTQVVVDGTGLSTTTASDGSWTIDSLPEGTYSLEFENGGYRDSVPMVEALAGSTGMVVDGSLYDLSRSPLTLYAGRRIAGAPFGSTGQHTGEFLLSPDGGHMLFAYGGLGSAALDGSGVATLSTFWTNDDLVGAFPEVAFSPDGARVAFVDGIGLSDSSPLKIVSSAGGAPLQLGTGGTPLWSPRGDKLAFMGVDPMSGAATLSYATSDGATMSSLDVAKSVDLSTWSSSGTSILYRSDLDINAYLGTLKRATLDGSPPVTVASAVRQPLLRADGRWALCATNFDGVHSLGDLVSVDLGTGTARTLATAVEFYDDVGGRVLGDNIKFAGDRAVYEAGHTIYSAPLDGSAMPIPLSSGAALPADRILFSVSADGSRVAFVSDCTNGTSACKLWTTATSGGTAEAVADGVTGSSVGLSSDGKLIWFTNMVDAQGLATLQVKTIGQPARAVANGVSATLGFSPDASAILFAQNDAFSLFLLADGRTVQLGDHVPLASAVFAPDGKHIAFSGQLPSGASAVFVAPLDGSAARALIDGSVWEWSAHNALIVFHGDTPAPYRFQNGYYVF